MKRADKPWIFQISLLPCFDRWGWRCHKQSWAGVSRGELIWHHFSERSLIFPGSFRGLLCLFPNQNQETELIAAAWHESHNAGLPPQTVLFTGMSEVCVLLKVMESHQRFIFCTSIDLISSHIWALICFSLGRFSYKLVIADLGAWQSLCLVTLSRGRRLPRAIPDSGVGYSQVSCSFMLAKEKHSFLPGVHLTYYVLTAHLFVVKLQASWVDKQGRLTRGRVFTDTVRIKVISIRRENHNSGGKDDI